MMINSLYMKSFIVWVKKKQLEILKAYIQNNFANNFIRPFKFFIGAFIFFN